MITYHYDVCILADSPATYLCARILTRKGLKVLLCESPRDNTEPFQSYLPLFVSGEGPLITLLQLGGVKLELTPFSLQIVLPQGRAEIGKGNSARELQWLFDKDYDNEMVLIEGFRKSSMAIKHGFFKSIDRETSRVERLKRWLLKNRLSREVTKGMHLSTAFLQQILRTPISYPFTAEQVFIPSPFYATLFVAETYSIKDHIKFFGEILLKDIAEEIDRVTLSEVQVDEGFRWLKIGKEIITFKFLVVDTSLAKELFEVQFNKIIRKVFRPFGFWFPLQLVLKKEGIPVGMGRDLIMLKPDQECFGANLIYLNRVDGEGDTSVLNVYSLWQQEMLSNTRWQEEIVGTVMDRLIELMPFINRHIVQLFYPENWENIPAGFFNFVYLLKKKIKLFKPAVRYKLGRNVFLSGPELFPQWGMDSYGVSAWFVMNKILDKISST